MNLGSIRVNDPANGVLSRKDGREVIAYWKVTEMKEHVMFYTDSNSLEFEERFSGSTGSVGKRFYPVTSSIINGDSWSGKWLTVMTDRSFAGSV